MTDIEIKAPRFSYLIPIPFILLLVYLFYKYALTNSEVDDNIFKAAGFFVVAAGAFLTGYFLLQFFRHPAIFKFDDKGFTYNPAGVSLGFVSWAEVSGVEEVDIKVVSANIPTYVKALAITLKDPVAYRKRFNAPLRGLMKISEKRNKGTILIDPASLQGKYEEVKKLLEERTK